MSARLMADSARLRPIFNLLKPNADPVSFQFQFSGTPDALNIQWSPSLVKQKIQDKIPAFVERWIEQNIAKEFNQALVH